MATPFKAVSSGTKDDYNFYQSQVNSYLSLSLFDLLLDLPLTLASSAFQVQINIECAFGKLVHCWGIFWQAIPASIGIKNGTLQATQLLH